MNFSSPLKITLTLCVLSWSSLSRSFPPSLRSSKRYLRIRYTNLSLSQRFKDNPIRLISSLFAFQMAILGPLFKVRLSHVGSVISPYTTEMAIQCQRIGTELSPKSRKEPSGMIFSVAANLTWSWQTLQSASFCFYELCVIDVLL